jgi:hypothetical protein
MISQAKNILKHVVPCGICTLALASAAAASPPASRGVLLTRISGDSVATRTGNAVSRGLSGGQRLDLRAPDLRTSSGIPGASSGIPAAGTGATDSIPFPSRRSGQTRATDEDRLPALGDEAPKMKIMSRPEEFARRVHREGLPVARLWQGHSALLSLGLNQRGKPGLWLIQKIP